MQKALILVAALWVTSCTRGNPTSDSNDLGADAGSAADAAQIADTSTSVDVGNSPDLATPDQGSTGSDSGSSDTGTTADASVDTGAEVDMAVACDYRAVNGIAVIEAENLPLIEDWSTQTARAGYSGAGYIQWDGSAFNNDPTHGVLKADIAIETPGRYQLQWHVRIGNGTNTTEHNDAWVRFADADDFYGLKGNVGAEVRRYPKPMCEDAAFTDAIEANPNVTTADCSRGSTRDGWLKVYSSGASDWRWSTFTSDNDASRIMVEFDSPGVYTLELAARADLFLIDRLVLHLESVSDAVARDLSLGETTCP